MAAPFLIRFSPGIPTFTSRIGRYIWQPGTKPVLLLFNDWDIFWVRQGEATWEFRDGRKMIAGPDEFALLPPFVPAMISESKAQLVFWYNHFGMRVPPSFLPKNLSYDFNGPGRELAVPLTFSAREAPEVRAAYDHMTRVKADDRAEPWRLERGTLELIAALVSFAQRRAKKRAPGVLIEPAETPDHRVARLSRLIDADPVKQWRVTELAKSVGLSAGRLHGLFRRVTGQSVKGYIVRARLKRALQLLKEQPDGRLPSVKEVSVQCGFASQHFFSRQFKAHYRISPLQYRNGASLA
ncbi:MAG TPA: AraC family transcriptional regulator [Planctomycetota bacterium]|nr:AraC family transcriptional regulator [Planctomycetota bacterium]